jgi:hypothetical protein
MNIINKTKPDGQRHSTAYTAERQGGVRWCSQFFMSWFLQPNTLALLYFFANEICYG